MKSGAGGSRSVSVALGVMVAVVSITLAGCSTTAATPAHKSAHAGNTATPKKSAPSSTIAKTSGGFVYDDAPSGYSVTFPQRPDVQPLDHNESDQPANYVSLDWTSGEFVSIGQVLDKRPNLQAQLMGMVSSMHPSGQVSASSDTLGGLAAAQAEFTTGDTPSLPSDLVGKAAKIVVAGDGNRFYELVALGGTADQRAAFFDSFKRDK